MAASMWEVSRLVLGAPGDAAGIAEAHGFTVAQVTDLLPLFLDNVTTGYDGGAGLPPAQPDGPGADAVARWLDGWSQHWSDGTVDVVSYDGFGVADLGADPFESGLDLAGPEVSGGPGGVDAGPGEAAAFGQGGDGAEGSPDGAPDGTDPGPDGPHEHPDLSDVDLDDLFDLDGEHGVDADQGIDGDLGDGHHDPGQHPDGAAGGDTSFH